MRQTFDINTIFRDYKNKVYHLALSITRNEKDAEDITQNTFLKVIKNLKYFRKQARISTWIYRIAYNEALMLLRKRKTQFRLGNYLNSSRAKAPDRLFVNRAKLPDEFLLDKELKEAVDAAIAKMPIKYRMPLLLDNGEGFSLKDCARVLGLKLNSLKTRLRRSHLFLKSQLLDYFKDKQLERAANGRKCNIWTGFIYDYARGYLGKRRSKNFRRHIKKCSSCNSFLDTYLKAIYITGAPECQDIPLELKDRIETFLPLKHLN